MTATILMIFGLVLGTPSEGTETFNVDIQQSSVTWEGAKVGGSHNGSIELKDGNLTLKDGQIIGGSFVIDMTSIANEDLSGEYRGKLEGHLKSDDFFGVESYPTAKFVITEAVAQGGDAYKIVGDITIKGITREIRFPATLTSDANGQVRATANVTIDRSEFKVKYGSGSFFDDLGDKVIYDNFDLGVALIAEK